jgi:pyruvate dehydrogenase E2 component (dihydrolipoamide acetyltransferase)
MAEPVIMPRQGQSVETCIIGSWHKQPGDKVTRGEVLFSYETDKAAFEYESEVEGTLLKRFYEEGDEVPVLEVVAFIGQPGEEVERGEAKRGGAESGERIEEEAKRGEEESVESFGGGRFGGGSREEGGKISISPRARKRAEALGIGWTEIAGTGPGGRIIERDVEAAAQVRQPATLLAREVARESGNAIPAQGTGIGNRATARDILEAQASQGADSEVRKISNMRKIIAAKMHESLQNSAQLTHHTSADARKLLELRKQAKEAFDKGYPENITINDLVCFAVIRAVKKHPLANCHFLGDSLRVFNKVHLGIAVDTDRGLMVPTVRNADDLSVRELSASLKSVAASCKKGNINPELLASESATFSVSNLGSYGVELFTPVINLPQVAILGVNTIINRPADLGNGIFGFLPYIGLSLTYDHRALDGAPASALLRDIRLEIENLNVQF